MTFEPYLHESPIVQAHAAVAVLALVLGAVQFLRTKGGPAHRAIGRIWVALMATVAVSGLFIWQVRMWWLFSPIHLLSLFALAMLWYGVRAARRGNIRAHRKTMRATYLFGLVITGLLTLYPGRTMYQVVFGPEGATPGRIAVFAAIVGSLAIAGVLLARRRDPGRDRTFVADH